MLTREQIEEIRRESREKGIPANRHFRWKRKYGKQEIAAGFLPVGDAMPPAAMSGMAACGAPLS